MTWNGLVSGIAEKADWALDNKTPQRAAVEVEDADVTWTPEDERAFIAELPTAVQEPVDEIVATALHQPPKSPGSRP